MSISAGLILGFFYAITSGPVNVDTLRRGVKGGFFDALALQTGTSVGRILYALLALFGAGVMLQDATLQMALGVFGIAVLFYLGVTAIRDGRALASPAGIKRVHSTSGTSAFWTGALLSLANPLAVVFWLSIGGRMVHEPELDSLAFLTGFFGGCIAASLCIAVLASLWSSRLTSRVMLAVSYVCGLVLIGFGMKLGQALLATVHF